MLSWEEHEYLVTQRAERDGALSRQRVAFGKNGNERFTKDRHDSEPSVLRGKPQESDVKPSRPQLLELLSGCQDLKDEIDVLGVRTCCINYLDDSGDRPAGIRLQTV
jgi:hypothetical protein